MLDRGLIYDRDAPHPLATNIDPTPWGYIEAIYRNPEVQLSMDPELWTAVWLASQIQGHEAGLTLTELAGVSGWFYDIWCMMTNTRTRLVKLNATRGTT